MRWCWACRSARCASRSAPASAPTAGGGWTIVGLTPGEVAQGVALFTAYERTVVTAFAPFDAVLTPTTTLPARPLDWYGDDPEES